MRKTIKTLLCILVTLMLFLLGLLFFGAVFALPGSPLGLSVLMGLVLAIFSGIALLIELHHLLK